MTRNMFNDLVLDELEKIRENIDESLLSVALEAVLKSDEHNWIEPEYQDQSARVLRGITIMYYFAFLQSHVSESTWDKIKSFRNENRSSIASIDWNKFDIFKYVRDCYAHSPEGLFFPDTQANTKHVLKLLDENSEDFGVERGNCVLYLNEKAAWNCYIMIGQLLDQIDVVYFKPKPVR